MMVKKLPVVLRTATLGSELLRPTDNLSAGNNRIVDVAAPEEGTDAVTLDYLTSVVNLPASSVTANDIFNWNQTYSWGDHALASYTKGVNLTSTYLTFVNADLKLEGTSKLTFDGTDFTLAAGSALRNTSTLVCAPGGTGAFQLSSTGNARGNYAVDLQLVRGVATQVAGGISSAILSGINNTVISDYSVIAGGSTNSIPTGCGTLNIIGGGSSNAFIAAATNNGLNFIGGGNNNRIQGQYCAIAGGNGNDILLAAGCLYSTICGGYANHVTESYATAGGYNNKASGYGSLAVGGQYNVASGNSSTSIGGYGNQASGRYSVAIGFRSVADKYSQVAQSSGRLVTTGDAQTSVLVARRATTNDTPTILYLDGDGSSGAGLIVIPVKTSWFFTIKVIARQTNDDFSVNAYHIEGSCSRDAGNIAIDYQTTITSNLEDATWVFTVSAHTATQSLRLNATGAVDNNINWVARVELVETTG